MDLPLVSVLMPVRNEAAWIRRSLGAVLAQDYPTDCLEVLVIDGASEDETPEIARAMAQSSATSATPSEGVRAGRVRVLHNPRRLQGAALNLGLGEARGEIVVRVDGHTLIAPDYVRQCVAALRATGAANVGGRMDPVGITATGQAIARATTSRFGVPAAFHTSADARETDTVYMGAWPRAVLERLGGFDETLPVNEDYELNVRIRRAGGRIVLIPAVRSAYYGRQTFAGLARQYFAYGRGKAHMLTRHPRSLKPRQLAAPAFVAALAVGPLAVGPLRARLRFVRALWLGLVGTYAALNLLASARLARRAGGLPRRVAWRVPLVFLTLHGAWGVGFWAGLLAGRHARGGRPAPGWIEPAPSPDHPSQQVAGHPAPGAADTREQ